MNPEPLVLTLGSMRPHDTGYNRDMNKRENTKQAKGNECSQYKSAAPIVFLQSAHLPHPYFLK
jgi:hypothetical protein